MSAKFKTRTAGPRDLDAVLMLCDSLNAHLAMPTGRLEKKEFRAALFGRNAFVFADLVEAATPYDARPAVVGYALSHDAFSTDFGERGMFLVDLYVEPCWRRAGAGLALMKAVMVRTKARGGSHVWWASSTTNAPARRFYQSLGASDERFRAHTLSGRDFDRLAAARRVRPARPRP